MNLHYLAGPLIGAVIGYCTNYIAVKMLFFPKNEIKLFGRRLPFTPGAIPKGKPRLAGAIGEIVGKTLLTKEDIESKLLSDEMMTEIADAASEKLSESIKDTLIQVGSLTDTQYESGKEKLAGLMSQEMAEALSKMELADVIAEKGGAVVKEKVQGTMLAMFLSDELIYSVTAPIGAELQQMIAEQGADYIRPHLMEKLGELEQDSAMEAMEKMEIGESEVRQAVSSVYKNLFLPYAGKLVDRMDISGIVRTKVNEMSVDELEDLVLTVMKKELNMIVNLGALIGFLLGLLNLFI